MYKRLAVRELRPIHRENSGLRQLCVISEAPTPKLVLCGEIMNAILNYPGTKWGWHMGIVLAEYVERICPAKEATDRLQISDVVLKT